MGERQKTFIMFSEVLDALKSEPPETQAETLMQLCEYAASGTEPTAPSLTTRILLNAFRGEMDANREKYRLTAEELHNVRSEAGKAGAAARWTPNQKQTPDPEQMQTPGKDAERQKKLAILKEQAARLKA